MLNLDKFYFQFVLLAELQELVNTLQTKIDSLTKDAEKAAKDAEGKIRKLTEENELLKKASDFTGMDEKTLTEVFKKVAPVLERFGYKVSLTKEAVSN